MNGTSMVIAVMAGTALAVAPVCMVAGLRHAPARLGDALEQLAGTRGARPVVNLPEGAGPLERMGARLASGRVGRLPSSVTRTLGLRGRSVADFMAEKTVWALAGLLLPLLVQGVCAVMGASIGAHPLVLGPLLGLVGWFLPDLRLRSQRGATHQDAAEAVLVYIDLVTLARLANQSATRCLVSAAAVTDHPAIARIRTALDRSRLEQQAPWAGLDDLARELELPQLSELVEVMRLDDQGASLAKTLRARVTEMRDAHLTKEKITAQQVSESMTVWMVVPVMVLGLALLTPPLLRIAGVAS